MTENKPSPKALISVSDKTGVVELARALREFRFDILSTGGTAKVLRQADIPAGEVSELTGFPEILGGRVKTLHPFVFGGILYSRGDQKHRTDAETHGIPPIDWVVVNLYPFERINLEGKLSKPEMIEFIDIGGVSLLRAAAKNYEHVVVLCDDKDYGPVVKEYKEAGRVSPATRRELAAKAFAHTAHYDSIIARHFRESLAPDVADLKKELKVESAIRSDSSTLFPSELTLGLRKVADLRYGENPQQKASLYRDSGSREWGVVHAQKIQGKELSFNNYLDLDGAWQLANSFALAQGEGRPPASGAGKLGGSHGGVCCVIVKHNNPCGAAISQTPQEAFRIAFQADSLSAFGGVIGFSAKVDAETARQIAKTFFECVIAPDYAPEALELFKAKPNLRVLKQGTALTLPYELDVKRVSGGFLVQEKDNFFFAEDAEPDSSAGGLGRVVSKRTPTPEELCSLDFAWRVGKFVKSNAIVLAQGTATAGIGAGQMSRIDALKMAVHKMIGARYELLGAKAAVGAGAGLLVSGTAPKPSSGLPLVMASDAFFPFRDCVDEAAKTGVSAVIAPGGSLRDQESIDAANEHNISMVFTGMRHFRH